LLKRKLFNEIFPTPTTLVAVRQCMAISLFFDFSFNSMIA
jgi:hypothetical protein